MYPFTPNDIYLILSVSSNDVICQTKNQGIFHLLPILLISSHSIEYFYYFLLLFQVGLGCFSPPFSYSDMIRYDHCHSDMISSRA